MGIPECSVLEAIMTREALTGPQSEPDKPIISLKPEKCEQKKRTAVW